MPAVLRVRMSRCLVIVAALALAACEAPGLSNRDAEWARLSSEGFRVVTASHRGAVISARGRQVTIDPAPGFCLAEDSIETTKRSVFLLIGDCAVGGPITDARSDDGELQLPRAVPGIMTVSISGDPGFRSRDGSYDALRRFLESVEGKTMLGRSGSGRNVEIKESRESDGALLLYLEDNSAAAVPILSNQFWRAFIELHGRLAVVTMSGFRDRPMGREKMFAYLISQVQALGAANPATPSATETRLASAETDRPRSAETPVAAASGAKAAPVADAPPGAGERIAAAPGPPSEIPRGNSRLERVMPLPPRRPGSRPPVFVADASVVVRPPSGAAAPSATAVSAPVADSRPAPPPTKFAPRTAPMAPKRR